MRGATTVNSPLRNDLGAVRIDGGGDGAGEASQRVSTRPDGWTLTAGIIQMQTGFKIYWGR